MTFLEFGQLGLLRTALARNAAQGLRSLTEILEGQVIAGIPGDPTRTVASCEGSPESQDENTTTLW